MSVQEKKSQEPTVKRFSFPGWPWFLWLLVPSMLLLFLLFYECVSN